MSIAIIGERLRPEQDGAANETARAADVRVPAATLAPTGAAAPAGVLGAAVDGPFYKTVPASTGFAVSPEALAPARRGYAVATASSPSAATAAKSTAKSSGAKGSSTTSSGKTSSSSSKSASSSAKKASTPKELAFLDDKYLSIQDKLFRFATLMAQKSDQELVDAMKDYEEKKAAAKKASSSGGGGGGLLGAVGDAVGGIGDLIASAAETVAKELGGPLLAAAATALGLPELAPIALKVGGGFAAGVVDIVATELGAGKGAKRSTASASSGSSSGSSGASSAGKTSKAAASGTANAPDAEDFDEKIEMLKLQRLVEKQDALFSSLSNVMKATHESEMVAVQNIR
jgi:hypothetical protein